MNSKIKLLPHNEKAYSNLIKCLEKNQFVSIDHATGTGKSFIVLKYLYEYRNKRLLYLSPSYSINNQLTDTHMKELGIDKKVFKSLDIMTYSGLLKKNIDVLASQYDIIILDEYHRCGACKWGKKVNHLLSILKEQYPEKKVIGTTATEIRYLDHEKNMNHILFNGVCASKLTLADAILEGILPVPIYINTVYSLLSEIDNLEKKINKKVFYQQSIVKYSAILQDIREYCNNIINDKKDFNDCLSTENAKYLVFCSQIKNIERDKKIISSIFDKDISHYLVHSKNSQIKNKKILDVFRNLKKGTHILYSINALNEGFHLKDIKAIFMLRPTKSPIIYFQQLGRLLSYSGRNDILYVFDFVNNLRNHPAIYQLYQEILERAKVLLKEDVENKVQYERILKHLKIVDHSSKIYDKLDLLKKKLTNEYLIKERLNTAVEILEGKYEAHSLIQEQALIDIFHYKNYITIDLFDRIRKLNIPQPSLFNLSREEFLDHLNKPSVISDKMNDLSKSHKKNQTLSQKRQNRNLLYLRKVELLRKKCLIEIEKNGELNITHDYYKELICFIKKYHRGPQLCKSREEDRLYYLRKILQPLLDKYQYTDKINQALHFFSPSVNKTTTQINKNDIIHFIQNHHDDLPSSHLGDPKEILLANCFNRLNEKDKQDVLQEQLKYATRHDDIVAQYAQFIKKNKRYPLLNSEDENEKELIKAYIRHEPLLTLQEKMKIKDTFDYFKQKQIIKNAYLEYKKIKMKK